MMRKTEEILGLPVITILDGQEVGVIRQLVINPEMGRIEYLLLNGRDWYEVPQVLPYKSVLGVGRDAITVESKAMLSPLTKESEVVPFLDQKIRVIGTRVYTRKGRLIGTVAEMAIEIDSGQIAGCELASLDDQALIFIPCERILTFGKDVLVVDEGADDLIVRTPVEPEELDQISVKQNQENAPVSALNYRGSQIFEYRQRQYLIGKKLIRSIFSDTGEVLARAGERVTSELLASIKTQARYIELTSSVED
ncbi:MAG: PRC-barrel domain-containing protein [Bacillota bacterium]|jgi:uncharacterized protein YrrD